jgi:hypothetical protein
VRVLALVAALTLLHGVVTIGPTTPVCRDGVPCSKPAAGVTLRFSRGTAVIRVRTDAEGRYYARLAPGVWTVKASVGVRTTPTPFTVLRVTTQRRNFAIDSGIR